MKAIKQNSLHVGSRGNYRQITVVEYDDGLIIIYIRDGFGRTLYTERLMP